MRYKVVKTLETKNIEQKSVRLQEKVILSKVQNSHIKWKDSRRLEPTLPFTPLRRISSTNQSKGIILTIFQRLDTSHS